jgi:predicted helicase
MPLLQLAANHAAIKGYYLDLKQLSTLHATHEGAVRGAFQTLLQKCARQFDWTVIAEYAIERPKRAPLRVDGAVVDQWKLVHGYWEAKDEHDDLKEEVKKKIAKGYPTDNILFQSPERAILYQGGRQVLDEPLTEAKKLVEVLKEFFRYEPPAYAQWQLAVEEFKLRVPELAKALVERIHEERKLNSVFRDRFGAFVQTCRQAINPNLSDAAVEEMLIQHMLTERIFRKVFNNPDFARRNAIAADIEGVVDALTARAFNRDKFLSGLERFYGAIERTAGTIDSFTEKQGFLNTVYEKFFQGFSVKVADTHGIVYTPQSIVRFMVRSVDEILKKEFGRTEGLGSKGVHILDPFLGTGNFLLHVMRQIPRTRLAYKYENELHGNEVMLLPYYIAAMNIEHEYSEMMREYKPFDGLCLVDTFELAEETHPSLFTAQNTARVENQRKAPIFVIIGNPPYNANQINENDNNKNRKYVTMSRRVAETYGKDSAAKLLNKLDDPYVKAFRWASDRIAGEGIVAFVSNSSYIHRNAFDGMRRHLVRDFDALYLLDLGGDVRVNPKLSGTTHNVFGIKVGVSIGIFIRRDRGKDRDPRQSGSLYYASLPDFERRETKLATLDGCGSAEGVQWTKLDPNRTGTWIDDGLSASFDDFIPLMDPDVRADASSSNHGIFEVASLGVSTNRDTTAYAFSRGDLVDRVKRFIGSYNAERRRFIESKRPKDIDSFLSTKDVKWSESLKRDLQRGIKLAYDEKYVTTSLYRPFSRRCLYLAPTIVDRPGKNERFFAVKESYDENEVIAVSDRGFRSPFSVLAAGRVVDLHICASTDGFVCFPFFTYREPDGDRVTNITDWALMEFRGHYADESIAKRSIFYYVYAILHHPAYRASYKANLKRELPRIPYAPDFWAFAKAGKRLAELHVDYEKQPEHPLERVEDPEVAYSLRVEKMRLSKHRDGIHYNDFLTLAGIPPEVFEYRLGNRSALEWVIDQYQVSTDKRSGITNDPNRLDDPEYIIRLIGQVVTVSLETVKIVRGLPPCEEGGPSAAEALAAMGAETSADVEADQPVEQARPTKEVVSAEPRKAGMKREEARPAKRGPVKRK